jgi:hypothetical protein
MDRAAWTGQRPVPTRTFGASGTRLRRFATRAFGWRRLPVGVSLRGGPGLPRATRHRRQGLRRAPIHRCRQWTSAERRRRCLLPSASEGRPYRPFLRAAEPGGAGPLRRVLERRRILAAIRGFSSWVLRVLVELSGERGTSYGCNGGGCRVEATLPAGKASSPELVLLVDEQSKSQRPDEPGPPGRVKDPSQHNPSTHKVMRIVALLGAG